MVKLYKYPMKGTWSQTTLFSYMTPLFYCDVCPGERINMNVSVRFISDSLKKAALNRMYFDLYSFFVPFRLLDSSWPDYIATEAGSSLPMVTDTWSWNYEGDLLNNTDTANLAWQRRNYNYVWNEIFRDNAQAAAGLGDKNPLTVLTRPRSFQNTLVSGSLPSAGIGSSVTSMRTAIADQTQQRMEFYFQGKEAYVEYLRAQGVDAGDNIDEGPRLIGQHHATGSFEAVVDTGGTSIGSPSGLWTGSVEMEARGRFPEHGVVSVYAIPRMEYPVAEFNVTPLLNKNALDHYYGAQKRVQPSRTDWSSAFVGDTSVTLSNNLNAPAFEDYRTLPSQMFASLSAGQDDNYAVVGDVASATGAAGVCGRDFRNEVTSSTFFRDFIGAESELAMMAVINGSRHSPVPPRHRSL